MEKKKGAFFRSENAKDNWLTPPEIIGALGPFNLDPCACPEPRPWPTAKKHTALPQDGLSLKWEGRVWLNPPYGRQTKQWIRKLALHGNGIALTFARTETGVFFPWVWDYSSGLLFLKGRLRFCLPNGAPGPTSAMAPSVLIAYGAKNAMRLDNCGLEGAFVIPMGKEKHDAR